MDWDGVKDVLTAIGWLVCIVVIILLVCGLFIGVKYLYAWIAEQLGIPYVWVL